MSQNNLFSMSKSALAFCGIREYCYPKEPPKKQTKRKNRTGLKCVYLPIDIKVKAVMLHKNGLTTKEAAYFVHQKTGHNVSAGQIVTWSKQKRVLCEMKKTKKKTA